MRYNNISLFGIARHALSFSTLLGHKERWGEGNKKDGRAYPTSVRAACEDVTREKALFVT